MLFARPDGFGSSTYLLTDGPDVVAEVALPRLTAPDGRIVVGGVPFDLQMGLRPGPTVGLAFEGARVAMSRRAGWFAYVYTVEVDPSVAVEGPRRLVVRPSFGHGRHAVEADGQRVGQIRKAGVFTRDRELDLPASVPLLVQAVSAGGRARRPPRREPVAAGRTQKRPRPIRPGPPLRNRGGVYRTSRSARRPTAVSTMLVTLTVASPSPCVVLW